LGALGGNRIGHALWVVTDLGAVGFLAQLRQPVHLIP
jgi:hypothetical protein